MFLRSIAATLVLAGFVLLGLAGYSYHTFHRQPALAVETKDLDLGDRTAGEKFEVVYRLDNRSGRPIRVLGAVVC